jgi:hypothetical protein
LCLMRDRNKLRDFRFFFVRTEGGGYIDLPDNRSTDGVK